MRADGGAGDGDGELVRPGRAPVGRGGTGGDGAQDGREGGKGRVPEAVPVVIRSIVFITAFLFYFLCFDGASPPLPKLSAYYLLSRPFYDISHSALF